MDGPKSVIANFALPYDSCGKDGNPKAGITNVQLLVNETLGANLPVPDFNLDGAVDIIDLHIVINSALGLGCAMNQG